VATPVGHALAGLLLGSGFTLNRPLLGYGRDLVLFVLLATAADLDFVPGILLGNPSAFHQGVSHSLGLALLVGLGMGLWGRRYGRPWRWALVGATLYMSHVVIDFLTVDTKEPLGVMLWWPLSGERYQSPVSVFLNVRRESFCREVVMHDLVTLGRELLIFLPPAGLLLWLRARRRGRYNY